MIDLGKELGVQSYTFRHFKDNAAMIAKCKESGVRNVELCGIHVDFNDEARFADVVSLYKSQGMKIVSIGVQGMANDPAKERKYFEFVKKAGARFMAVTFDLNSTPACYRTAEKLADEYDIRLAIHNHGGRDWLGCARMLSYVMANTSPRIGLCLDTAWALDSREDPVKMARDFGKRLYGLHVKDFVFDRARKPQDVVVGTGNLNLAALAQTMRDVDFNGYAVLEYEGDVENPAPAVKKCVEAVKTVAR
jgi:sugar phosphate isomerase/epimerase